MVGLGARDTSARRLLFGPLDFDSEGINVCSGFDKKELILLEKGGDLFLSSLKTKKPSFYILNC
jgi:hypothetical protein